MPDQPPQVLSRVYPLLRAGVVVAIACSAVALVFAALLPLHLLSDDNAYTAASYASFMIRTFRFHIGLGLLPLVGLALLLRMKRPAVVGGLLLGWTLLPSLCCYLPFPAPAPLAGPTLSVMSMNLLRSNTNYQAVLARISEHDPDVILFQEYTPAFDAALRPVLSERYPYFITAGRDHAFGQATFSKLDFLVAPATHPQLGFIPSQAPGLYVGSTDPQIRVTVPLAGREVVIQNVHLSTPINFQYFRDQHQLFHWLAEDAADERRAFIIGGDFNATPNSAEVEHLINRGLRSAHTTAGFGSGCTWPDTTPLRFFPHIKIDHLLYQRIRCDHSAVAGSTGSDHRPIIARFGFSD